MRAYRTTESENGADSCQGCETLNSLPIRSYCLFLLVHRWAKVHTLARKSSRVGRKSQPWVFIFSGGLSSLDGTGFVSSGLTADSSVKDLKPILCSIYLGLSAKQLYLARAFVQEAFPSLVQSAEIAVLHVVCVTNRISDLVTGELSWQTLVLVTPKFIKSRQADLWFGYASEKHKCAP